jgi:hypothetical protein
MGREGREIVTYHKSMVDEEQSATVEYPLR